MNDCLVTKLKSVVDNDNLKKLNEIQIYINEAGSATNFQVTANANGGLKATPIVGTWNDLTTTSKECNANGYIQNNGVRGTVVSINNKFNLKNIGQESGTSRINLIGDLEQLKFCTDLEVLQGTLGYDIPSNYQITGNLSSLSGLTKLKVIILRSQLGNISGNIDALVGCTNLEIVETDVEGGHLSSTSGWNNLRSLILTAGAASGTLNQIGGGTNLVKLDIQGNTDISGYISDLSSHYNLETLYINGTNMIGIKGTLESLVKGMASRTKGGTLAVKCNSKVTLGGVAVGDGVTKTYNFSTQKWS